MALNDPIPAQPGIKLNIDALIADAKVKDLGALPSGRAHLIQTAHGDVKILDISEHTKDPSEPAMPNAGFVFGQSFCTYVDQIGKPKRLYGTHSTGEVRAHFNDDEGPTEYGTALKSARFCPVHHHMAAPWLNANGKSMTQTEFSDFLSNNSAAVSEPSLADIDTVVRNLEINRSSTFSSKVDLVNGNHSFTMTEDDKPKGNILVPKFIKLCFPMYHGSEAIDLVAALRYRHNDGHLTWSFHIFQLDAIKAHEIEKLWKAIETELGIPILW